MREAACADGGGAATANVMASAMIARMILIGLLPVANRASPKARRQRERRCQSRATAVASQAIEKT